MVLENTSRFTIFFSEFIMIRSISIYRARPTHNYSIYCFPEEDKNEGQTDSADTGDSEADPAQLLGITIL